MAFKNIVTDFASGLCTGVFIDETGSPGLAETPSHLHPSRKSWVAVIVPANQIVEVMEEFPKALAELSDSFGGAKEFHSKDIYRGNGPFREVPIDDRLNLFRFFVYQFQQYSFPILIQTLHPDSTAVDRLGKQFPEKLGPFDLTNYSDLALFLLIIRIKSFLLKNMPGVPARLCIDAGRFEAGAKIPIPGLDPPFKAGEIFSADSSSLHPIQLADFAGFVLNRTQLLLGKEKLKYIDKELLQLIQPMTGNFVNMEWLECGRGQWPPISESELISFLMQAHASQELD